jgi:hypothetical protein
MCLTGRQRILPDDPPKYRIFSRLKALAVPGFIEKVRDVGTTSVSVPLE